MCNSQYCILQFFDGYETCFSLSFLLLYFQFLVTNILLSYLQKENEEYLAKFWI